MCGRFALTSPEQFLEEIFGIQLDFDFLPQYNIAPTENVLALISENESKTSVIFRWGFAPSWLKEKSNYKILINARAETVDSSPAFRDAFKKCRCLILANGFYEWIKSGKDRIPYFFHLNDNRTFAFAGIWSKRAVENHVQATCVILTTAANEIVSPFHDRMPVILPFEAYEIWLNGKSSTNQLKDILLHPLNKGLAAYRVTRKVNSALYKGQDSMAKLY